MIFQSPEINFQISWDWFAPFCQWHPAFRYIDKTPSLSFFSSSSPSLVLQKRYSHTFTENTTVNTENSTEIGNDFFTPLPTFVLAKQTKTGYLRTTKKKEWKDEETFYFIINGKRKRSEPVASTGSTQLRLWFLERKGKLRYHLSYCNNSNIKPTKPTGRRTCRLERKQH